MTDSLPDLPWAVVPRTIVRDALVVSTDAMRTYVELVVRAAGRDELRVRQGSSALLVLKSAPSQRSGIYGIDRSPIERKTSHFAPVGWLYPNFQTRCTKSAEEPSSGRITTVYAGRLRPRMPLTDRSSSGRLAIPGGPRRHRGWLRGRVTWRHTLPICRGAAERWPPPGPLAPTRSRLRTNPPPRCWQPVGRRSPRAAGAHAGIARPVPPDTRRGAAASIN